MKPRWKIVVELIVAVTITLFASNMVANVLFDGGPLWNWLAIIVVWKGLDSVENAWKEL